MSLFDVIKYPISDLPTLEELESLPEGLFDKWVDRMNWPTRTDINDVAYWYSGFPKDDHRKHSVSVLRHMIRDLP